VLDIRSSELQGTEPALLGKRFNTRMPLNVQEIDFGPHSQRPPAERSGITDASISLLYIYSSDTLLRLDPFNTEDAYFPHAIDIEQIVDRCVTRFSQYYSTITTFTLQRSLSKPAEMVIGQLLTYELWLHTKYPIEVARQLFSLEAERDEGLSHAVSYLQLLEELQTAPDFEHLAWWFTYMIPW
jgi:hypothetical protein